MRKITPKELMAETIAKAKAQHPELYDKAPTPKTEHPVQPQAETKVEALKVHEASPQLPEKQAGARKPRMVVEKPQQASTYIIEDTRSPRAIAIDRGIQAKDVVTRRNKEGVSRWKSHPNQMDVRGVDTLRTKAPRFKGGRVVIDTRGHKHRQKRGSVL